MVAGGAPDRGAPGSPAEPVERAGAADAAEPVEQRRGASRRLWAIRAAIAVVHVVVFAPLITQAVNHPERWPGPDDYTTYLRVVLPMTFSKPWVPGAPHFVWFLLVRLVSGLLPGTYNPGAIIVSLAFVGLTGVVWFEVLRMRTASGTRMRIRWAAVGSLALVCMEAPSTLRGWATIYGPNYWMPLHAYLGPTGPAARPLLAALVLCFSRVASNRPGDSVEARRTAERWLPWIAMLATVTKPSVTVDLIPASVIVGWVWARRDGQPPRQVVGLLVRRFVLPTIGLVALQYSVMAFQIPAQYQQRTLIRPLRVFFTYHLDRPFFWTALLLPLAMLAVWGRRLLQDRDVELTVWCFGFGLVALLTLASSNLDRGGLDAIWFLLHPVALFLLFGTRRAAELHRTEPRPRSLRYGIAFAVCIAMAALFVFTWVEFTSCQLGQACFT